MGPLILGWTLCGVATLLSDGPADNLLGTALVFVALGMVPGWLLAAHQRGLARLERDARRRAGAPARR